MTSASRGVRMQTGHSRHAAVERDEQVEALSLAHLADHDPVGAHAQRFLHQPAQRDLARAFQVGLSGLHRHHVRQRD
ncbi:MAG TPA: hypothetical protein VHO01_05470, partial [Jatrophihabitans sp.]|nr:hypothetical protein [Jatrophihabitans sp.]